MPDSTNHKAAMGYDVMGGLRYVSSVRQVVVGVGVLGVALLHPQ